MLKQIPNKSDKRIDTEALKSSSFHETRTRIRIINLRFESNKLFPEDEKILKTSKKNVLDLRKYE